MRLRAPLFGSLFALVLGAFACGEGRDAADEIPDEAVQSDEAAPSQPSPEDSL